MDQTTRKPLRSLTVSVEHTDPIAGVPRQSETTDEDGTVLFRLPKAGRYRVTAAQAGYSDVGAVQFVPVKDDGGSAMLISIVFELASSRDAAAGTFEMVVQVKDEVTNQPVPGASVDALAPEGVNRRLLTRWC